MATSKTQRPEFGKLPFDKGQIAEAWSFSVIDGVRTELAAALVRRMEITCRESGHIMGPGPEYMAATINAGRRSKSGPRLLFSGGAVLFGANVPVVASGESRDLLFGAGAMAVSALALRQRGRPINQRLIAINEVIDTVSGAVDRKLERMGPPKSADLAELDESLLLDAIDETQEEFRIASIRFVNVVSNDPGQAHIDSDDVPRTTLAAAAFEVSLEAKMGELYRGHRPVALEL